MAAQPQPGPVHAKSFVADAYDKFEDKKITRFAWPATLNSAFYSNFKRYTENEIQKCSGFTFYMTLRHVKNPELDAILLDYEYQGEDWGWVRDGKLIVNIDGANNITLEPTETDTSTGFGDYNGVQELGYYIVSPEQLEAICNAQSIEIKVTGGKFNFMLTNNIKQIIGGLSFPEKFLFMARAFYSGLYSDDSYLDHLKKVVESTTANEQERKKKGITNLIIVGVVLLIFGIAYAYYLSKHH